jgi:hypothetical protein
MSRHITTASTRTAISLRSIATRLCGVLGVINELKMTEEKDVFYHSFTLGDLQLPNKVLMTSLTDQV